MLLKYEKESHRLWVKATCLCLITNHLYRCSYDDPYLNYVQNDEAKHLLVEIHER